LAETSAEQARKVLNILTFEYLPFWQASQAVRDRMAKSRDAAEIDSPLNYRGHNILKPTSQSTAF
jgi:hypothetical protein